MKAFIQGTVLGVIITAAVASGYAYGTNRSTQTEVRPGKVVADAIASGMCRTTVGYGRITYSDTCFRDEVVVGSRTGYILCADITVTCD